MDLKSPENIHEMSPKELGRWGEMIACDYLKERGYEIIDKNWRYSKYGEIDIVAVDRCVVPKMAAFVEVKTRRKDWSGHPLEAINRRKMLQMRMISSVWNGGMLPKGASGRRLDSIGIKVNEDSTIEIVHLKGVC